MAERSDELVERLGALLRDQHRSVAVAESLTGGSLSAHLAVASGSSEWYAGGLVAYSRDAKHRLLGVPHGPVVCEEAAAAMARGVAELLRADLAVAVTGVGGPEEQDGVAPGTVWMGLWEHGGTRTRCLHLPGGPADVVDATIDDAVHWLVSTCEDRGGHG